MAVYYNESDDGQVYIERRDLEKGHVVVMVSVKEQDLEVAVHVRAIGEHLAVHLVALPRLLLVTVVDTVVRAETYCVNTHTHTSSSSSSRVTSDFTTIHRATTANRPLTPVTA